MACTPDEAVKRNERERDEKEIKPQRRPAELISLWVELSYFLFSFSVVIVELH